MFSERARGMNKAIAVLSIGLTVLMLAACTKPAGDAAGGSKNAAASKNAASVPPPTTDSAAAENANSERPSRVAATPDGRGRVRKEEVAPAPANANSNTSTQSGGMSEIPSVQKLVGTYELNEMQKGGVTTIMSKIKTQIVFTSDGRYSLATTAGGRTTHTESGQFHLEGDSLVFSMVLSDKDIKTTPVTKRSKVTVIGDGRELRVISKKGNVAVFYRIG